MCCHPEKIVVATCDRKPSYLDRCLKSMFADKTVARVRLEVCGGSTSEYIDPKWVFRSDVSVEVVEPTEAERELAKDASPQHRNVMTSARALSVADGISPVVFFEDDALCGKNWFVRAREAAATLEKRHGDNFILALYAAYRLPRDQRLVKYHPSNFYGNVSLWLAPATAVELGRRMRGEVDSGRFTPPDMVTKGMVWGDTPTYAHSPSLINHIGDVSSHGNGKTRIIRAQSYLG